MWKLQKIFSIYFFSCSMFSEFCFLTSRSEKRQPHRPIPDWLQRWRSRQAIQRTAGSLWDHTRPAASLNHRCTGSMRWLQPPEGRHWLILRWHQTMDALKVPSENTGSGQINTGYSLCPTWIWLLVIQDCAPPLCASWINTSKWAWCLLAPQCSHVCTWVYKLNILKGIQNHSY